MFAPPVAKPKPAAPAAPRALQRKCACGAPTSGLETCPTCARERSGLQRKLAIGSVDDPLEHEADRVADQVLADRSPSHFAGTPIKVQRYAPNQAQQAQEAPASVDRILTATGRRLDAPIRRDMEARFGHDFSQVRVHDGDEAGRSAGAVGASAYTVGRNIVFGPGRYAPESGSGRRLLAHELTHVLQQGAGASGIVQRDTIDDIKKYLSYDIFSDWMVTEQDAELAFQLLKALPADQQATVLMAEGELYLDRLYDNLPSEFLPELAQIAVKVRGLAQAEAQKKSSKKGTAKGAKKSSEAWRQLTSHGGRTLEREEQELIASITKASPPTSPLAFAEGPRFVLHDTAGHLEDDIDRRVGLARGPLGDEGAAAYVPEKGPAVPSYGLFEPRRVASSQFERGTDFMVRADREAGYRGIWKEATAAMRSKALVDALAGLDLSEIEAKAEKERAVSELNATGGEIHTTGSWVATEICKAAPLKACKQMKPMLDSRESRIASTVNVEINMEIGSSEKEIAKGMGERLPPYTENQYTNVRDFYLTTALAAGCYPKITTHWLLDRGMKEGGHYDPRCFDLHHLYELTAAAMGHEPTSEYGIVPVYGVASPANVWWHSDVCGKPPR